MDNKPLAITLLIIGIVFLIFGITSLQSISSDISQAVSGTPNTKAIILLVLSAVFLVFGGSLLYKSR